MPGEQTILRGGYQAIYFNSGGLNNVSYGYQSMYNSTTGNNNTALGANALYSNKANSRSVAVGFNAMYYADNRTTGRETYNTAVGYEALRGSGTASLNTGQYNVAVGDQCLMLNSTGYSNVALGCQALYSNQTGNFNVALGHYSAFYLASSSNNTCVGAQAGDYYTYSSGTFLGALAYPTASGFSNCMALGYDAHVNASNKVVIGNTYVSSIGGYAPWTDFSDGRFKKNIREEVPGLAFIRQLRPVIYTLDIQLLNADQEKNKSSVMREGEAKQELSAADLEGIRAKEKIVYTGFVAQEVEAVAKSIGYNFSGVDVPSGTDGYYGLRYSEFVVPLVKAVQEQQAIIEDLLRKNEELQKRIEKLENR